MNNETGGVIVTLAAFSAPLSAMLDPKNPTRLAVVFPLVSATYKH